ncbi:MAG: type II and III secretion system protein family protein [Pseudomonadota bacterium]
MSLVARRVGHPALGGLFGLLGLMALLLALSLSVALAAGRSALENDHADGSFAHVSFMEIDADAVFPVRKKITIGVDKSMLIELPVELQNVLVSNPEVVDAVVQTSTQVYLLAKDFGEANAFFIGPDGQRVLQLEVSVTRDLAALQDAIHRLLPGADVQVEMMGKSVVLSGYVSSPADANRAGDLAARFVKSEKDVLNMLGTDAKEQVLLKVQVAEMQRDALRRLGVDIPNSVLNAGNFTFAKVIENAFPVTGAIVPKALSFGGAVAPAVAGGSALQQTFSTNNQSITTLIQALERAGVVKTLAEPTLTALSGETAKFLAGGEFPVPISLDDNRIALEWKEFGVNVSFSPIVLDRGRISLKVSAEVSELSSEGAVQVQGLSFPGLKVRRAETTLEMPSGGTLAMAGLLSDDTRQSAEGLPGLRKLPVLGALFRSTDYRRRETELVILVTPFLAKHAAHGEMAKPTDNYAPSATLRELFFGRINRIYGVSDSRADRYHGEYGFIVDYPGVKG